MHERLPWVWDYDIDADEFRAMLAGELRRGRLGRDWAALRLVEHAPYEEIVQWLGFAALSDGWPQWRDKVRSPSRKRGLDFLVQWLAEHPQPRAS
ncbi:MAG: hypothetical protein HY902_18805 [Deltaproteobacteria bacterium]|nr:hypothetical protein [Deltaproteobacteria bacterium]